MSIKKIITVALLMLSGSAGFAQPADGNKFALGADISWYTQMEGKGYAFADAQGKEMKCTELMKSIGMSAVRLRVWVNPQGWYCCKDDVVSKAWWAKEVGLDVLIDFHFSDGWADPGQQTVPAAWKEHSYEAMRSDIREHVVDVLTALKDAKIEPKWVQLGNETNNGMLWPVGNADENPGQYAGFISEANAAVKSVFPNTKTIVHLSNAFDKDLYKWNLGILRQNNAPYDIIGMSLYPDNNEETQGIIDNAFSNIQAVRKEFGKPVMIVETGVPVNKPETGKAIQTQIIRRAMEAGCLGVFYWEPEAFAGWNHYNLGAATVSGKTITLTKVMEAYTEAAEQLTAISTPSAQRSSLTPNDIYSLCGIKLSAPQPGINIIVTENGQTAKVLR